MQTEELVRREPPRDVRSVSSALLDLAPPDWQLTSSKGKPVALSSAGYVLHFGQAYQVRVAVPDGAELPEVRLVGAPSFIARPEGSETIHKHGRRLGGLTFRVHRDLWRFIKGPAGIRCGDLDIECTFGEGMDRRRVEFRCPVIVRIRWGLGIILLLFLWAFLTLLFSRLESAGKELLSQGPWQFHRMDWGAAVALDLRAWLWLAGIAALAPVGALAWHIYRLWRRSGELETRYQTRMTHAG